jgi:hypothetical protein
MRPGASIYQSDPEDWPTRADLAPAPPPVCECTHTIDMHYPYTLVGTPCDLCCCPDYLEEVEP